MRDTTQGLFATFIGIAVLGAGLYLLSDEIAGNLVPLAYFAMIAAGAAMTVRGVRVFGRSSR